MVLVNSIMQSTNHELLEENYNTIIEMLCKIDIPPEKLEMVKYQFKEEIASIRRYENIKTMEELLKLLEVRDVISCENINKLYDIVDKFMNYNEKQNLGKLLIRQTRWLSKPNVHLTYFPDKTAVDCNMEEFYLPRAVTECISSNISRSWSKLARALKIIKEKDIDLIEELDDPLIDGTKTKKCLEIYVHEVQIQRFSNPYEILLKALDSIGRRDVKEKVEKLLRSISI